MPDSSGISKEKIVDENHINILDNKVLRLIYWNALIRDKLVVYDSNLLSI